MIARIWKGTVRAQRADAYLEYLEKTGLAKARGTPGNRAVSILRRTTDQGVEFTFRSDWESWDAIRAFAGPDPEIAVYFPEDRDFLLEMTPGVEHHEIAVDERG